MEFKDRIVEYPNRYTEIKNSDGTITLIPSPGVVVEAGTPLNAGNLKALEKQSKDIVDIVTNDKYQWGIENGMAFLERMAE